MSRHADDRGGCLEIQITAKGSRCAQTGSPTSRCQLELNIWGADFAVLLKLELITTTFFLFQKTRFTFQRRLLWLVVWYQVLTPDAKITDPRSTNGLISWPYSMIFLDCSLPLSTTRQIESTFYEWHFHCQPTDRVLSVLGQHKLCILRHLRPFMC